MTNVMSVSWAAYWLGSLWLRFMPTIPLPFEGGRVRKWQSYVQVLHMIGNPKVGFLPTFHYVLLQKAEIWKGIYCAKEQKSTMNIITLSTLIRMKLLLALPLPWLNLTSSNGPHGIPIQWYRMKWEFAIFQWWLLYWTWQWWPSAGVCLVLSLTKWKKMKEWEEKEVYHLPFPIWLFSSVA